MKSGDLERLIELRRALHRRPELANAEIETMETLLDALARTSPDELIERIGGHGLAAVYRGASEGPRVLIRSDMDALPIDESLTIPHASTRDGVSHKCGHDGHMAILVGLGTRLAQARPERGSVVLLFQPAEETGEGARRVIDDPRFLAIRPDTAFALHNLPGFPRGAVVTRSGTFASASRGMVFDFLGRSSHAAEPDRGRSPALAVAQTITALSAVPQVATRFGEASKVTVIHASVGERAFGTSPGRGAVMATLRSHGNEEIEVLAGRCREIASGIAAAHGLGLDVSCCEEFPAVVNDAGAVAGVERAAQACNLEIVRLDRPNAWSEDFGHFTRQFPGALIGLGAGRDHPPLHSADFDFPDELIQTGVELWVGVTRELLGGIDREP